MPRICAVAFFVVAAITGLAAKDAPSQVINWPASGAPVVRVTLGKFKEVSSLGGQRNYMIDTTVENFWDKKISRLVFALYLFDKNKARIGEGWLNVE